MRNFLFYLVVFVFSTAKPSNGQAIDNTVAERNPDKNRYARVHYENDFYTKTDYYYTQGMFLEVIDPGIKRFFFSKLLWQPTVSELKNGIALEHNGYTPKDFSKPGIQFGDRPFAATLLFKTFSIATDTIKKRRISTTLSTGIIGPAAGGGEIQTGIHRKTGDAIPLGWHNQISNYPVVNYQVRVEQELLSLPSLALLSVDVMARLGTLSCKTSVGGMLMAGFFNQPYQSASAKKHKVQFYGYLHPQLNVVAYDASLQGGFFVSDPYTILTGKVKRLVFQQHAGVVVKLFGLYVEYFQSWTSPEFTEGKSHGTGGLQVGYCF